MSNRESRQIALCAGRNINDYSKQELISILSDYAFLTEEQERKITELEIENFELKAKLYYLEKSKWWEFWK